MPYSAHSGTLKQAAFAHGFPDDGRQRRRETVRSRTWLVCVTWPNEPECQ